MTGPTELRTLAAELRVILERIAGVRPGCEKDYAEAKKAGLSGAHLVAALYQPHSFYTGLEDAFFGIAHTFENEVPRDRWHAGLLQRTASEMPGVRPAVIDGCLFGLLDEFRGFRRFFRHSYGRRSFRRRFRRRSIGSASSSAISRPSPVAWSLVETHRRRSGTEGERSEAIHP
jgi:hypothetical protein